jgi:hypothetical protein
MSMSMSNVGQNIKEKKAVRVTLIPEMIREVLK